MALNFSFSCSFQVEGDLMLMVIDWALPQFGAAT
jgi:hypothetical protein